MERQQIQGIEKNILTVLVVEPLKKPYTKEMRAGLSSLQEEVGGLIAVTYPFDDPVVIICNDEGKLNGMKPNRSLCDEDGEIYDIVCGTFVVAGLGEDDFDSLSPEMMEKYADHFKNPEVFALGEDGEIKSFAIPEEELRTYDIYQLKCSPNQRDYAFKSLEDLRLNGRKADKENYEKIYSGIMHPMENLEHIYIRFNCNPPGDFTGHSLSMSDVVVIHRNGKDQAYYCDQLGFIEVPEFMGSIEAIADVDGRAKQVACETEEKYFAVQTTEGGYDYTIYGKDFRELDGGVYDNPDISIWDVMEDILSEEGVSIEDCHMIDYEQLMEKTEEIGQTELRRALDSMKPEMVQGCSG